MKITYSWIKEFIDLKNSPEELVEIFEGLGIEVEDFRYLGEGLKGKTFVGEVIEIKPHPGKPQWKVLKVTIGRETFTSVSTAPNLKVGGKVVFALPGTRLPNGREIETKEMMKISSFGMPLSEEELGVPIEATGIINLPRELKVGESPLSYLLMDDWLYDLYITPNRPDLLSALGLARELHVKLGIPLRKREPRMSESETVGALPVHIDAPDGCPRYTARLIRGVKVTQSPPSIRYRLAWCGIRPINSVVDATNYVLLEMGQPIHAFDISRIEREIRVRFARKGEEILTLDGMVRSLTPEVLIIADSEKPIAIAGIMGGEESGVTETTRDILIESAYFDPVVIRKGSSLLGLESDSSFRFARGTDPMMPPLASLRVAQLVSETSGGSVGPLVDRCFLPSFSKELVLRKAKVEELLGVSIPAREATRILRRMGLGIKTQGRGRRFSWKVTVPLRRVDIDWEADLIEEIARFYGYDRIPGILSRGGRFIGKRPDSLSDMLAKIMLEIGFSEILGLDFVSREDLVATGISPSKQAVRIKNPLGEPYAFLRTNLLFSLLNAISNNLRRGREDLRLFEVGRVFFWRGKEELPSEPLHVAAAVAGEKVPHWKERRETLNFYDVKGALDHLAERMGWQMEIVRGEYPFLKEGGDVAIQGKRIGWIGEIEKGFLKRLEIKIPVFAFEIEVEGLRREEPHFRPLPQFPPVKRDLSLLVPDDLPYREVLKSIVASRPPYLASLRLIDLYHGKPLPSGQKSMTFSLLFQDPGGTLRDEQVDRSMEILVKHLRQLGLQVRGIDNAP